jgi:acylphosphatase
MKTFHYVIKGNVQGVGFRYHTVQQAQTNHIRGTVKNLHNGDVEVYAQGVPEDLIKFDSFLRSGPPFATVKRVSKEEVTAFTEYSEFEVVY